ncbi:MAG: hypothetical protein ABI882_01255 [Acidobacteriota bacterium]
MPERINETPPHESQLKSQLTKRLMAAVSIKTLLEIIFVCIIVSIAAVRTFHPSLRGTIDIAEPARINGWAYDPAVGETPVEVQLFVDGKFVAAAKADALRADLVDAGAAPRPYHGFSFPLDAVKLQPGQHTAQVYAVRTGIGGTLTLIPIAKHPLVFEVP